MPSGILRRIHLSDRARTYSLGILYIPRIMSEFAHEKTGIDTSIRGLRLANISV